MKYKFKIKSKILGFTLIELLVVISIVSLLSSITLSSANETRAKARDSVRRSDISQLRIALELYRTDNEVYPDPGFNVCDSSIGKNNVGYGFCFNGLKASNDWDSSILNGVHLLSAGGYISRLPLDPINNASFFYSYRSCSGGTSYVVQGTLEKGGLAGHTNSNKLNADTNNDGIIDVLDFALVSNCFEENYDTFPICRFGDLNHNGKADMGDINIVQDIMNAAGGTANTCD